MTPRTKTPTAAAIYCRISLDRNGEGLGVKRQETLCRKLAREKRWTVAEVYVDNDISASNGKHRPAYERMLADIEAGTISAVLCVDLDRLTRRPAELEHFVDLADRRKVALANVSGDTDLGSSDGRFKARIMGAVARQESEKKGERVAREAEQAARDGIPRGTRRCFGYEPDRVTIRLDEAELIREATRRVLAGETIPAICRDWNRLSVPTPRGAAHGWLASSLASVLRNPRIAGLRTHKGEVVAEGKWPPIVDRPTFETLQARIRRVARVGRPASHLLSGTARCGRCGGPLWTSWRYETPGKKVARYACTAGPGLPGCGKLTVAAKPLDDLVRDAAILALAGPALAKARKQRARTDKDQAAAVRDLAHAEERLDDLAGMYATGELSRREFTAGREKARERIAAATRILDADTGITPTLPADEAALRAKWDAETIEWRRALVATVLDAVTIKPAARPAYRFDPERVDIAWKA